MRRLALALAAAVAACGSDGSAADTATTSAPDAATDAAIEDAPDTEVTSPSDVADVVDAATSPDTTTPADTSDPDAPDPDGADAPPPDAVDPSDVPPDAPDTADTSAGPDLAGPCPLAIRRGGFQVVDDGEYGWVDGTVEDGVLPVSVLELVATEGDCHLYKKTNPFCDPPCQPGEACDFDGACLPHPEPQDVGTVTLTGLAGPVAMPPIQPGNLYYATDIPYPPWTPGAALALAAPGGGTIAAFALEGVAPAPLAPTATQWTLVAGQALDVAWAAPADPAPPTRVELSLLIDQHGNSPASLRCDFADDGQASVPSALLDALRTAGVSGFPSGRLVRQTVDHAAVAEGACVDFAARSPRSIRVTVSGHVPCTKDQDCPSGTTCDEAIETCVDD